MHPITLQWQVTQGMSVSSTPLSTEVRRILCSALIFPELR